MKNKKESPLRRQANYSLQDIFRELKYGRPAEDQKYLDKCIEKLDDDDDENTDNLLMKYKLKNEASQTTIEMKMYNKVRFLPSNSLSKFFDKIYELLSKDLK